MALGGLAFWSLVLALRAFGITGWIRPSASNAAASNPITAASLVEFCHALTIAASSRGFEAVEYRTGTSLSSFAVRARTIGEFPSLEKAIDAARVARSQYTPQVPGPDAWWVVWNLGTRRASWIAEWDTPGESVIDLRSGRREPHVAQKAHRPSP